MFFYNTAMMGESSVAGKSSEGQARLQVDGQCDGVPLSEARSEPGPRVAHFFLLTTCCAVIATVRAACVYWDSFTEGTQSYARVMHIFYSIIFGAALAGLMIVAYRLWNGLPTVLEAPGHWLILVFVTSALIEGAAVAIGRVYQALSSSPAADFNTWHLEHGLLRSGIAISCFIFSWLMRGRLIWKVVVLVPGCILLALVPVNVMAVTGTWRNWFFNAHAYAQLTAAAIVVP